jgi:hypothetical protein
MPSVDTLTHRIRVAFLEQPSLKITFEQACTRWQTNEAKCLTALERLIAERFLLRSASGAFLAPPRPQTRP